MPKHARVVANEKGRVLYRNIRGFVEAKRAIDETAERVLPHGYMSEYPSFKNEENMTQMPLGGGEPNAMTLGGVREAAAEARPIFERVMRRIADSARLDPDERVMFEGKPLPIEHGSDIFYTRLMIAPPKGEKRCVEKIETEYGGKACLLVDMVRCSVVVDAEEQLISVAKALDGGAIRTADGDVYEVVRLKNRFKEPLFNGYRDALYSVRVQIAPGVWHVCEMQLHLAAVIAHKEHTHTCTTSSSDRTSPGT